MQRIGIYSGTFDPVHPGHVAFALETQATCALERVIFLPERTPRGKEQASSFAHRHALLMGALEGLNSMEIMTLKSTQFTVSETLPELRIFFPKASITMLVGSDVIHTFPYRWDGLQVLLREVELAIGLRIGDDKAVIEAILTTLEHEYMHPIARTYIETAEADLASTHIRNGTVDESRLHPATLSYIRQHKLYTS